MTINEFITAKSETAPNFGGDFAGYYDITDDEAARILATATSVDEFETIVEDDDWWTDEANEQ